LFKFGHIANFSGFGEFSLLAVQYQNLKKNGMRKLSGKGMGQGGGGGQEKSKSGRELPCPPPSTTIHFFFITIKGP